MKKVRSLLFWEGQKKMSTKQATLKFRGRHYQKWHQNGVINYFQSCVSSILNNEP